MSPIDSWLPANEVDAGVHTLRHVRPGAPTLPTLILAAQGLHRFYRLDELTGTNAVDAAGAQNGTYNGSPTLGVTSPVWSQDEAVTAVTFSGTTQFVSIPSLLYTNAPFVTAWSWEMVVRVDSLAAQAYLMSAHGAAVADQSITLSVTTAGALTLDFFSDALASANGTIVAGTWYHIAATRGDVGDVSRIYVNGSQVGTNAAGPYVTVASPTCRIAGYSNGPLPGNCTVALVATYARALSATEVAAHYQAAFNTDNQRRSGRRLLGTGMIVDTLPTRLMPNSPGISPGSSYTQRLQDAGEMALVFPDAPDTKGEMRWATRFDTAGHRQFIEIQRENRLELVGCVQNRRPTLQGCTVAGLDGFGLLRKAVEQDNPIVAAPRDVVADYSRLWTFAGADDFEDGIVDPAMTTVLGTITEANGRLRMSIPSGANAQFYYHLKPGALNDDFDILVVIGAATSVLTSISVNVRSCDNPIGSNPALGFSSANSRADFSVTDSGLTGSFTSQKFFDNAVPFFRQLPMAMEIRRRGRFTSFYLNGVLLGQEASAYAAGFVGGGPQFLDIQIGGSGTGTNVCELDMVAVRTKTAFLQRGTDRGDYVLPGGANTFPYGGLKCRYYNHSDLTSFTNYGYFGRLLAPSRQPYAERVDETLNNNAPPTPGVTTTAHWTARWIGAIYLSLDNGDTTLEIATTADAVRVWVGKTRWGDQIIDSWSAVASRTLTGTISASALGGKRGWYPIVVEYAKVGNAGNPIMNFTPAAGNYTDPGGTAITGGAKILVPSTSLSPLGVYEDRPQGQTHEDIVKAAAASVGYQLFCEPMALESGEFPGRLVARVRVGQDTDQTLGLDDVGGTERMWGVQVEEDAAELATTLKSSQSRTASSQNQQAPAAVYAQDITTAKASLFDIQGAANVGEISSPLLLGQIMLAQLALRLTPWQNVSGDNRGRERLALLPLTGAPALMRWMPGWGVRLNLPEVDVVDRTARQIMQRTCQILGTGRPQTQIGFRQRPKDYNTQLVRMTRAAIVPQRAFKSATNRLTQWGADTALGAGAFGAFVQFQFPTKEKIQSARFILGNNTGAGTVDLEINSTIQSANLGGPWSLVPTVVDITAYAVAASASDSRLFFRVRNNAAVASTIQWSIELEVAPR